VPARTLSAILDDAKAPITIALLSLDVEGAELKVLRGLDFAKYRIHWILVESRSIDRIAQYLAQFGFSLAAQLGGLDFLFELGEGGELAEGFSTSRVSGKLMRRD
jgi:hypothetical protein